MSSHSHYGPPGSTARQSWASNSLRLARPLAKSRRALHIGSMNSMTPDLHARVTAWRQHLHANPEISLQERDTAAFVCQILTELGVPFTAGVGGHGVVATLRRGLSNRSVGLRGDMDALPITESTGLPYASTRPGVMHACGHDGHTAGLLGAAALLVADAGWTGTVQLIFQPAEEGYGGARSMLADGMLDRFPMEQVFGLHNWPGLAAGTVAVHAGPVMAAASRMTFTIRGHAGHAAIPNLARDPVAAAGQLLVALQTIVARTVDPLDAAVVSVCMLEAGTASNIIPDRAVLRGTFRTHTQEIQDLVEGGMRRVAAGVAKAGAVTIDTEIQHGVCSTVNHAEPAALAIAAAQAMGAPVRQDLPPSMAGEDFGWLLRERPGAFIWVGNGPATPGAELHNRGYNFNDAILPTTSGWLAAVAKRALGA